MRCFVRDGRNGMGCLTCPGDKNSMGCFVRGGNSVRVDKKWLEVFCPGMFCPVPFDFLYNLVKS